MWPLPRLITRVNIGSCFMIPPCAIFTLNDYITKYKKKSHKTKIMLILQLNGWEIVFKSRICITKSNVYDSILGGSLCCQTA